MKKKIIVLFIALLIALSMIGCGNSNNNGNDPTNITPTENSGDTNNGSENNASDEKSEFDNTGKEIVPTNTLTESETSVTLSGVLHKVNVTETDRLFVKDGKSDYIIISGEETQALNAAGYISQMILRATGVKLVTTTYNEQTYSDDAKYIVIGCDELFTAAGLTMPTENLGVRGYYIKSKGNSVFIATAHEMGYQMAALSFLKYTVGYTMYADDTVAFTKSGETLPDMDIAEKPDYDYTIQGNRQSAIAKYGMGATTISDMMATVDGQFWHNTLNYFPREKYFDAHPEWYATTASPGLYDQLCYTARGNKESYDEMVSIAAQIAIEALEAKPDTVCVPFVQQDNFISCDCDACKAAYERYGGSHAGQYVVFANDVDDIIQKYFEDKAKAEGTKKREVYFIIMAYHNTEAVPSNVVCNDTVGVLIAPIFAKYSKSFTETENTRSANVIKGWAKICKIVYAWLYETNYRQFLYPFNTFYSVFDNYKFCREYNTTWMYGQQQYMHDNVTAFGKLKEYLMSALTFDVTVTPAEVIDPFFDNYYKDASGIMRKYFDELQIWMRHIELAYPTLVSGDCTSDAIATKELWPQQMLEKWMADLNDALKAISKYEDEDPELYKNLKDHIMLETIFPRYALIQLHGYTYSADDLNAMQVSFMNDCNYFGIAQYEEGKSLTDIYQEWGII